MCRQRVESGEPRGDDGYPLLRHAVLEARKPDGIGRALGEQAVALAHKLLKGGKTGAMIRIERDGQTVEKAGGGHPGDLKICDPWRA